MNTQIFGPTAAAAPSPSGTPGMDGFVINYQAQTGVPPTGINAVMHYYTMQQVPAISSLARQFAVCDCWHASAPCQTWPNRFFVHTGTANGYENNSPAHFPYEMPTIYERLDAVNPPLPNPQQLLGHASRTTTEIYVRSRKTVKEAPAK
jgi:phospholipase C